MTLVNDKIDLPVALKKYKFAQVFYHEEGDVQHDKKDCA